jgi:hypothetical protein
MASIWLLFGVSCTIGGFRRKNDRNGFGWSEEDGPPERMIELETIDDEVSTEFKKSFHELR